MSDLNFWGRALFYPHDNHVKRLLSFGHADILAQESGRVLHSRIQKIMRVPLQSQSSIDWDEVVTSLIVLKHRYSLKSSYFSKVVHALKNWSTLNDGGQRKAVGDAFMYLLQSDPKSNLLAHMRSLSGSTMINDLKTLAMKVLGIKRLGECKFTLNEEGEAISTAGIGSVSGNLFGGSNNIITPPEVDIGSTTMQAQLYTYKDDKKKSGKDKLIKKRTRTFKAKRFKAPEGYKLIRMKKNDD